MPFSKPRRAKASILMNSMYSWLSQGFYGLLLSEWPLHMVYSKTIDRWETKGEQKKDLFREALKNRAEAVNSLDAITGRIYRKAAK